MGKRVLIAEDDADSARLYQTILRGMGHDGEIVASGAELLNRAKAEAFDLLLVDLMMPGGTGTSALTFLREDGVETPALVITGKESTIDLPKACEVHYKPLGLQEIRALIEEALV